MKPHGRLGNPEKYLAIVSQPEAHATSATCPRSGGIGPEFKGELAAGVGLRRAAQLAGLARSGTPGFHDLCSISNRL
jgi:hypothetical protein